LIQTVENRTGRQTNHRKRGHEKIGKENSGIQWHEIGKVFRTHTLDQEMAE
jgi:hypothetical protein